MSETWPLVPEIIPRTQSAGGATGVGQPTLISKTQVHLGRCVVRPLRRDEKNDFASAEGALLVNAAVVQVLGTIADTGQTRGELPWRTDFGSAVELLRHQHLDAEFEPLADQYAFDALQRWEPRCIVRQTQLVESVVNGSAKTTLRVSHDVAATSTPGSEIVATGLTAEQVLT